MWSLRPPYGRHRSSRWRSVSVGSASDGADTSDLPSLHVTMSSLTTFPGMFYTIPPPPPPPPPTAALYIPLLRLHLHHTANKTKCNIKLHRKQQSCQHHKAVIKKNKKTTKENIFTEEEKGRNHPERLICSFTFSWSFASVSMRTKQGLNLPQSTNSS